MGRRGDANINTDTNTNMDTTQIKICFQILVPTCGRGGGLHWGGGGMQPGRFTVLIMTTSQSPYTCNDDVDDHQIYDDDDKEKITITLIY